MPDIRLLFFYYVIPIVDRNSLSGPHLVNFGSLIAEHRGGEPAYLLDLK